MQYKRPIVISVAGYDPSGGAGVLADIKTFEQNGCLGMAVVSALTVQTEAEFISVEWLSAEKIITQLKPLLETYSCEVIKIGIIQNLETLQTLVNFIHGDNKKIKVVWDTVLSSSSGFDLLKDLEKKKLEHVLGNFALITPNTNEILKLSGINEENAAAIYLSKYCPVLLKGGHSESAKGKDVLFMGRTTFEFNASAGQYHEKHGSGCILSSAIAAQLALGKDLEQACKNAKSYIEKILISNPNLLAYHA